MKEDLLAFKTAVHKLIAMALTEDIGPGDVTTAGALQGNETGFAKAVAKSDTVVAGINVFRETFLFLDPNIRFTAQVEDGDIVQRGDVIAVIQGRLGSILMAERTALNFLQRMCGIATQTRRLVEAVKDRQVKIIHTRKTVPGLRILDTYAVRVAGGHSHRFGLFDGALIKENHIAAAGSIAAAVANVRRRVPITVKIEVEVENLTQVAEALSAGADVIMFDNMGIEDMKKAVIIVAGRVPLEASGNVTLANVKDIAGTGVNYISSGALTHSVTAADISLRVEFRDEVH
ncbi:MAG: carboxylating nicotinate-nucleotide diphosphorylase [Deltaproteobacteria bacterium]|nr:carboxylating nicotinate-nucleotide diphosphorylase [Deltaproteobacteria bacterium]